MLQSIRDRAQGWLAWLILGAIALVFTFWGVTGYLGKKHRDNQVLVKVGEEVVSKREVQQVYEQLLNTLKSQENAPINESLLRSQALESLVFNKALVQAVKKAGYKISSGHLDEILLKNPSFQEDGKFSSARYLQILARMGLTAEQYKEQLANGLMLDQLKNGFMATALALPSDFEHWTSLALQTRDIVYAKLPLANFLKNAKASESEIKAFYEENQKQFTTPEQLSIEYVQLSLDAIKKNIKFTEAMGKSFYDTHKAQFSKPEKRSIAHIVIPLGEDKDAARSHAENILKQLRAGQSFDSLARKHSADPVSAKKGGRLPPVVRHDLSPELAKVVFGLKQDQPLSDVVMTKYGYQIVKLLSVEKARITPYEKVIQDVREQAVQDKALRTFADKQEALQAGAYESPDSLAPLADSLNLKVKHSPLFTRQGGEGLFANLKIIQAAFGDEVLAQKYNSDLINIDDNTVVVLRLAQHLKPTVRPLSQVTAAIENFLKHKAAAKVASDKGHQVIQQLAKGKARSSLAKTHNLQWVKKSNLSRDSKALDALIVKRAFMTKPQGGKPGYAGLTLVNGDYVVVGVLDVLDGTTPDEDKRLKLGAQLQAGYGQLAFQMYAESLIKGTEIERINKD